MKKKALKEKTAAQIADTHEALQTIVDALPPGQKRQLIKDPNIKALLERYGVEVS